ncbi:MAG: hypothetical protein ABII20_04675 [Candidatus Omnitrophota bacterium]|nr:hypothetical protein [Candidatus Omnitrophota bacterium]MBU2529114.1 hypothetical protein [bacterium]MBU3929461.1 hypothetical protein [bacterium]MBU4122842.1 hypothetical protein [bacterium]
MKEELGFKRIRPKYGLQTKLGGGECTEWSAKTGKTIHKKWKPYRPEAMLEEKIIFSDNIEDFERLEFITLPSFHRPWQTGIYRRKDKYFAACEEFKRDGYSYDERRRGGPIPKTEAEISKEKAMEVLNLLKDLVHSRKGLINSSANASIGCDGTIEEFKFKSGSNIVFFRWWMALPEGYDTLQDMLSIINDCVPS